MQHLTERLGLEVANRRLHLVGGGIVAVRNVGETHNVIQTLPPPISRPQNRIEYIDAARGMAMCFACASHFAGHYLLPSGAHRQWMLMQTLSMLASPTFMIVSGVLIGYMYSVRPERFPAFRAKVVDRGLFLLIVGHLLILIPKMVAQPQVPPHTWVLVTDVIGLSVVTIPWLMPLTRKWTRFWAGIALYAASLWFRSEVSCNWPVACGLLWGGPPDINAGQLFPLMAWMPLYLVGTTLGEQIGTWRVAGGDREVAKRLAILGLGLTFVTLLAWRVARVAVDPRGWSLILEWTNPWHKLPPGPAYFALQSGLGITLLATLAALQAKAWAKPILRLGTTLGRASLFVFVLQFYVYNIGMRPIRTSYTNAWPVLLLLSIAFLFVAADLWNRKQMNNYLTLGLERRLSPRNVDAPPLFRKHGET